MELAAQLLQLQHLRIQLFPGSAVTAGDLTAKFQQQPHQGAVADPQTQHGDFLIFQRSKVGFKCRCHSVSLISIVSTPADVRFFGTSISLLKRFCKTFDNSTRMRYNIPATRSDSRGHMPKGSG